MLDFFLTSDAIMALLTLTFLEIILGIDNIVFIYGIASLIINLYIIPVFKDKFESVIDQGKLMRWKKGTGWHTYNEKGIAAIRQKQCGGLNDNNNIGNGGAGLNDNNNTGTGGNNSDSW